MAQIFCFLCQSHKMTCYSIGVEGESRVKRWVLLISFMSQMAEGQLLALVRGELQSSSSCWHKCGSQWLGCPFVVFCYGAHQVKNIEQGLSPRLTALLK